MYGNNASRLNNGSDLNVNTNLRTSNSEVSSMTISLWNQYLSLKIRPAVGVDANGITQYDKNRVGQTALSPDACQTIYDEFVDKIYPEYKKAVETGEPCPDKMSVTVETGKEPKRNIVGIEMTPSTDSGNNVPDLWFVIYSMVDSNNMAVEANAYRHKFPKKKIRVNYNPSNGYSDLESYANADFNIFLNGLGRTELMLPYSEHVKKYSVERAKSFTPQNNGGGYNGAGSGYQNGGGYGSAQSFASKGPSSFDGVGFGGMLGGLDELPFN